MSFGTFSAKYGAEPKIPLEMHVDAEHPFGTDDFTLENEDTTPSAQLPPSAEPTITPPLEVPEIPWSLVIPAALIGIVAIGVGWYLTNGKKVELPI